MNLWTYIYPGVLCFNIFHGTYDCIFNFCVVNFLTHFSFGRNSTVKCPHFLILLSKHLPFFMKRTCRIEYCSALECVCVYVHMWVCVCMYVHVDKCMHMRMCMCVCEYFMYMLVCVSMFLWSMILMGLIWLEVRY